MKSARSVLLLLTTVPSLAICWLDVVSGRQYSPWALYALPIALAAWLGGRRWAVWAALQAVLLIAMAAAVGGHPFESHWALAASLLNRGTVLVLLALLVNHARDLDLQQSIAQSRDAEI